MSESGLSYQFVKGLYQTGLLLSNLAEMDRQSLPGEAWDEQGWQRFVQAGVETGLVSVGPELAGFISFWVHDEETELLKLAVIPSYRRQGLGEGLVKALLQRQNSGHRLFLEVRVSNQKALYLYRKMGFTEQGLRRQYYQNPKEDALVLSYMIP